MPKQITWVQTTLPDEASAARLAQALVTEGLAACVQRTPIRSVYQWDGAVCDEAEIRCDIKTSPGQREALITRLIELHPYDVPEVLILPEVETTQAYGAWVSAPAG